jgi:hypothetical protein
MIMKRRTEIDLSKMSESSRSYYLQDLLADLADCIQDLSGDHPRYDYVAHCIEHAEQAREDLAQLSKLTEEI